ncbi:hypothetical protein BCD_1760 (plasmid) [Borrelia crocidurae DOU]|uniref:Uncharacterized protein n=1 Tax=Borrelia crocidurae DOU TaxID=1293575 RepID=W5SRZ5_9SPIR|nr:hypothetical protein BCD_1760 [Borrelia crocidurae DOU]
MYFSMPYGIFILVLFIMCSFYLFFVYLFFLYFVVVLILKSKRKIEEIK